MTFQLFTFYAFSAVLVASALAVITVRNPVYAALFLVLTFFTAASIWMLAEAEFLAIALVLVYVGAVMVLFLFVVMMLDVDLVGINEGFVRFLPVGIGVAVVMLAQMLMLIGVKAMALDMPPEPASTAGLSNVQWIGRTLFNEFLLPFEIAAVILTVAIVAAVPLSLRPIVRARRQNPSEQVRVKSTDRLRMVKMEADTQRGRD